MKGGGATYLPGDYEYYLGRLAREEADAEGKQSARPADVSTVSVVQRERQEQKRMKSELRSLEKAEEQLMERLEELEAERKKIEESMASPEVYSNGERMRTLAKEHETNQQTHALSMEEWEGSTRSSGACASLSGNRAARDDAPLDHPAVDLRDHLTALAERAGELPCRPSKSAGRSAMRGALPPGK